MSKEHADSVDDQLRYAYSLRSTNQYDKAIRVLKDTVSSQAPGNVLFNMNKDYLIASAYLAKKDCRNAKIYTDKISQGIKSTMLFTPWNELPPLVDQGNMQYNAVCPES